MAGKQYLLAVPPWLGGSQAPRFCPGNLRNTWHQRRGGFNDSQHLVDSEEGFSLVLSSCGLKGVPVRTLGRTVCAPAYLNVYSVIKRNRGFQGVPFRMMGDMKGWGSYDCGAPTQVVRRRWGVRRQVGGPGIEQVRGCHLTWVESSGITLHGVSLPTPSKGPHIWDLYDIISKLSLSK